MDLSTFKWERITLTIIQNRQAKSYDTQVLRHTIHYANYAQSHSMDN